MKNFAYEELSAESILDHVTTEMHIIAPIRNAAPRA